MFFGEERYLEIIHEKPLIKAVDLVDIFWQYKYEENNLNSRERDFLRFTSLGRWFINA